MSNGYDNRPQAQPGAVPYQGGPYAQQARPGFGAQQAATGGAAPKDGRPPQQGGKAPGKGAAPQKGKGGKGKNAKKPKAKRPASFWVAIAVATVAVVVAGVLVFVSMQPEPSRNRDANALIGQIDGKTEAEIQAELDRIIEEGMLNISIASEAVFEDGTSEGKLNIENVPGNRYLMQVDIARNDTGETVYTSGILDPNYHISTAKLDKDLPAGTYECTATFNALDPETEEEVGSAAAVITIIVKS